MPQARIYIIRHGETHENRAGIMQGQLDTSLNDEGIAQALVAATALENVPITEAFSSHLKRAADTAKAILDFHPGVQLCQLKEFSERHLGGLQGKLLSEKRAFLATFPGGIDSAAEAAEAFIDRTLKAWDDHIVPLVSKPIPTTCLVSGVQGEDYVTKEVQPDRHEVLVVSHGGFIGALVQNLLLTKRIVPLNESTARSWKCYNASITTIDLDEDGKGRLLKYGDISHLGAASAKVTQIIADVEAGK
ncbi:phosphoglycerate mutase [Moniliophthora roreri MCA 2997]|uniref:Phosphoglycerate mutase n=2 Tax=Moniliophthora roreri TaxID=221103 RepID=V2YET7_MONRO|nr:phosphoglycerate mutase [Moniliophthora roreri MCA 2997]KAI3615408.1 phosphoglycerate mutase [Moniliophthora roreri]